MHTTIILLYRYSLLLFFPTIYDPSFKFGNTLFLTIKKNWLMVL